ncbi:MAG: hypothetical protein SFV19_19855, partial [Rhodospirillaceae bacterium]|nr:hypothetical protein [Rhodospirillaceae bacterium]
MTTLQRKQRPRLAKPSTGADTDRGPALRFLPLVIVATLCMLGVRIQVVVTDIASQRETSVALSSSTALAQAQQPAAPAAETPAEAEDKPMDEKPMDDDAAEETAAEAADDGAPAPGAFNPSELTKSEIDTLQRLAERREIIDRRERELQQKEGLVKAAEQRL